MTTWVLIMIIYQGNINPAAGVATATFHSREQCQLAEKWFQRYGPAVCVEDHWQDKK